MRRQNLSQIINKGTSKTMRKIWFQWAILCLCLMMAACGGRGKGGETFVVDGTTCRDLREIPQDLLVYANALPEGLLLSLEDQAVHAERARGWLHAPSPLRRKQFGVDATHGAGARDPDHDRIRRTSSTG